MRSRRYAAIAFTVWAVASLVVAIAAAVGPPTWQEALAFAWGWALIAAAGSWSLDALRTYRAGERSRSPQAILDERLARGEITLEEHARLTDAFRQR